MHIPLSPPAPESWQEPGFLGPVMAYISTKLSEPRDTRYWHWDDLRHRPVPAGLSSEQWWAALKVQRVVQMQRLPLRMMGEQQFSFAVPTNAQRLLHWIDQQASGRIELPEAVASETNRDSYLFNSLVEEAVRSSQLEGASTTRNVAKRMIQEQRTPSTNSERMIFNNYQAMVHLREIRDQPLTPQLIHKIHRIVSQGTLEDDAMAGRYRRESDDIHIVDGTGTKVLYTPPSADSVAARIDELCAFANTEESDSGQFIHPLLKAILLHFMIGFIHPYIDGNGRTARALFYWYALKRGYWLMEFVSISKIIKQTPAKYGLAYLHVETDAGDTNYFLLHQLDAIKQAIESLQRYLQRKTEELKDVDRLLDQGEWPNKLNHRQLAVIKDALRKPHRRYDIEQHKVKHRVSYQTARTDLLGLSDKLGLLEKRQRQASKAMDFHPVADLATIITNSNEN
jgi:Fic family protein